MYKIVPAERQKRSRKTITKKPLQTIKKRLTAVIFGTPGWVRTSGLSLRRRPLYPTELRGLIQKIFNFTGLQDSNDSIFRRRTLYPGEVRGHIQNLFNYTRLRDSNGSIVRRRSLYPAELQAHMKLWESERLPPGVRRTECFAEQNLDAGGIYFPRADPKVGTQTGWPVWERNPPIPNYCNPISGWCQR